MSIEAQIIIIEDDISIQTLYRTIANNMGITYHIMNSISEARLWLKIKPRQPKLFVLDHCLPDGEGITLATEIRQHFSTSPEPINIALVSAIEHYNSHFTDAHIDHLITKPFKTKDMRKLFELYCDPQTSPILEPMSTALDQAFAYDLRTIADHLKSDFCDHQEKTQRYLHSLTGIAGMLGQMQLSHIAKRAYNMSPKTPKLERKLTLFRVASRAQLVADTLSNAHQHADTAQRHSA